MAKRLKPHHQEDIRQKIKATQLVEYLQDHALNNVGYENSPTRVRAALGLLAKVLPDVSELRGPGEDGAHRFELLAPWLKDAAKKRGWG